MCIGCGACIDACDQIMDKVKYPKKLIRYTSERAMLEGLNEKSACSHLFRPRVLVYSGIILALAIAFVSSLAMRNPLRVDVIRDRGVLWRELAGGMIENVYRMQLINTSDSPMRLRLNTQGVPGLTLTAGRDGSDLVEVQAAANILIPVVIRAPSGAAKPGSHFITVSARTEG